MPTPGSCCSLLYAFTSILSPSFELGALLSAVQRLKGIHLCIAADFLSMKDPPFFSPLKLHQSFNHASQSVDVPSYAYAQLKKSKLA